MTSVPSSTTMRMLERVLLRRNGHAVLGGHGDAGAKLRLDTSYFALMLLIWSERDCSFAVVTTEPPERVESCHLKLTSTVTTTLEWRPHGDLLPI